jgi:formylglycine-generating enzyme required for sulfatase activity
MQSMRNSSPRRLSKRKTLTAIGWRWRESRHVTEPILAIRIRTQPVVGVSWYEAVSALQLVGQKLRRLRLPSESEWGKAAERTDARFLWGDRFEADRANTTELGAVARRRSMRFPRSESVRRVRSRGNVFEWT